MTKIYLTIMHFGRPACKLYCGLSMVKMRHLSHQTSSLLCFTYLQTPITLFIVIYHPQIAATCFEVRQYFVFHGSGSGNWVYALIDGMFSSMAAFIDMSRLTDISGPQIHSKVKPNRLNKCVTGTRKRWPPSHFTVNFVRKW